MTDEKRFYVDSDIEGEAGSTKKKKTNYAYFKKFIYLFVCAVF